MTDNYSSFTNYKTTISETLRKTEGIYDEENFTHPFLL